LFVSLFAFVAAGCPEAAGEPATSDLLEQLQGDIVTSAAVKCPDAAAYSLMRPDAATGPTVVGLGVFFQDLVSLNDADQTLDMDVYVLARWRDPRLADASRGKASADCPVPSGHLWMPQLEPERLRSRQALYAERFLVDGQGIVTLMRRLWAKVSYPLDFHDFPLDRHQWRMTIWPVSSRMDELKFEPLSRFTGRSERLSLQGWRVGIPRVETSVAVRDQRSGTFARFDAVLPLERDWSYYIWKSGFPLTLIVIMAYGVYYIPPSAAIPQLTLGTTSMLTLIAYMLTLGGTLPRISYLTRADWFFAGSALLVFVGLMKAVASLALAQAPTAGLIKRVDWWGRWLYPVGVLANFLIALLS
jgi:hypothetical protein